MTGRVILIEGTDATGKSTVARHAVNLVPSRSALLHAGPPTMRSAYMEYVAPLRIAYDGWTVVCDRWHLGEPIWSQIFARDPILHAHELQHIEHMMFDMGVAILPIYMWRNEREIAKELESRNENPKPSMLAISMYEDTLAHSTFDWHRCQLGDGLILVQEWLEL